MALIKFDHIFTLYIFVALYFLNFSALRAEYIPALATWYGDPEGAGSDGGACGYGTNVGQPPFNSMVSAGNDNIYKSGKGCGACYQVKCTENSACSGNPITITITDECPGACFNSSPIHFDLSGTAFGALAVPGQADALRKAGVLNIQHKRVPCTYPGTSLAVKIDPGSNLNYLAFVVEYVPGNGELSLVKIRPTNSDTWLPMEQSWGVTWKIELPFGSQAPFSISVTTTESSYELVETNVIPVNWAPGQTYYSVSP